MTGIINIDKPAGWTSHDVVAKLRGVLKQKRIGHGGTLDPMATGVLPVFIGRATRAAEFCENAEKEYTAGLRLGIVTDTQDITGNVLHEKEVTSTIDDLIAILPKFTGAQKQIPPMYSAIKKDGQKLYELARRGIDVPREARDIYISELEFLKEQPDIQFYLNNNPSAHDLSIPNPYISNTSTGDLSISGYDFFLRVVCSKGTYIRTLCHDIGSMLGCGGTLSALRRTRAGVFSIDSSHSLDDVYSAVLTDSVSNILLPVDSIFSEYPAVTLNENEVVKAKNGAVCTVKDNVDNGKYRIYGPCGEFLLFGDVADNNIKTIKSFFEVH